MDQLPVEILMKIFSYLNRYEEVSLVCKRFYDVACKVDDPNICLRVDRNFNELEWLPSIRNSNRQIRKIEFVNIRPSTIISIVKQFSGSIKVLRLHSRFEFGRGQHDVNMSEFLEILSLIPNVEDLRLFSLRRTDRTDQEIGMMSSNDDLNLQQLKALTLVEICDEFMAVFQRLPEGVLTELLFDTNKLNESAVLFKRQKNIKNLNMHCFEKSLIDVDDVFENLKLESLILWMQSRGYINLTQLLSKQATLKSLSLGMVEVEQNFINFVANRFTELESFSMDYCRHLDRVSSASIASISSLKTMKNMSFSFDHEQHNSLAEYHNPGITKLSVSMNDFNFNFSFIQALGKSVPNLKVLDFWGGDLSSQQLNTVMSNFNFVEALRITVKDNHIAEGGDCYNPKLTKLKINVQGSHSGIPMILPMLDTFIASYPNLKKLEIVGHRKWITASQFRRILDGYGKLESLKLDDGVGDLTRDDLNYLQNHGNNLKNIYFGRFSLDTVDVELIELKRQFYAIFGVIICDGYSLRMAVDRVDRNISNKWRY